MDEDDTKAKANAIVRRDLAPVVDRAKAYRGANVGPKGGRPYKAPPTILKIERLSDGAEVHIGTGRDDFTGEAIEPVIGPAKGELKGAVELDHERAAAKQANSLALVQALGLARHMPKPVPRARRR